MFTEADRQQLRAIYGKTFDWDPAADDAITVWQVWGFVISRVPEPNYERFKRLMRAEIGRGHFDLAAPPGEKKKLSMSRMHVRITDKGADWWMGRDYGSKWEDPIGGNEGVAEWTGHRIRVMDTPIPRDVWQILVRKLKSGELDVAFLEPKNKKTGGS